MKHLFRTFSFFMQTYRRNTVLVICLLILAGLAEAIGVAAFLPFLQIILESSGEQMAVPEGRIADLLAHMGLQLNLLTISLMIAVAICGKAGLLWVAMRYVSNTVARISADLRQRLMVALLKANWRFFVSHTMGSTLNAVVTETFRSSMAFVSATRLISSLIQFLVYATGAFILSWKMFAGGIGLGLFLVAMLWFLVRMARSAGMLQTQIAKDMMSHMADMLQGIKSLRAMALEQKFLDLLGRHSRSLEKAQVDQLISAQAMRIFHEPLMVITAIAGLSIAMAYGNIAHSELALMAILFMRLLTGMNNAQAEYQRLVTQESALWSLLDTIREAEGAADNWPGSGTVQGPIEKIEFRNVHFSHADRPILGGVNLDFKARTLTAIVGGSGSGKTTILDLLSGFYKPDSGEIVVNDSPLEKLDLYGWRHVLGFVPQEVFLFNDSIFENIAMGRTALTEADIWAALQAAGAKEFVESLHQGLYAPVGENGRMLSGGQRQRIAIARAIVHKPQILLLDEATSAVDQETEQILLRTLRDLAKDITVIFVSHNRAVRSFADAIYEVDEGQVKKTAGGADQE